MIAIELTCINDDPSELRGIFGARSRTFSIPWICRHPSPIRRLFRARHQKQAREADRASSPTHPFFQSRKLSAQALIRSRARQDTIEQITCQSARNPGPACARARWREDSPLQFTSALEYAFGGSHSRPCPPGPCFPILRARHPAGGDQTARSWEFPSAVRKLRSFVAKGISGRQ